MNYLDKEMECWKALGCSVAAQLFEAGMNLATIGDQQMSYIHIVKI
jgi:hypothetical protein